MGQLLRVAALTLVVAAVCAGSATARAPGTRYSVTDLGTLGASFYDPLLSVGFGINDHGDVAGMYLNFSRDPDTAARRVTHSVPPPP